MGRPKRVLEYSAEIAGDIARLRAEGESPRQVCSRRGMPALKQYYSWIQRYPEFAELMDQARQDYAATLFDRAVAVADEAKECQDPKRIPALRLSFDALCYAASRSDPGKYSPTSQIVETKVESYADVLKRIADDIGKTKQTPKKPKMPVFTGSPVDQDTLQ